MTFIPTLYYTILCYTIQYTTLCYTLYYTILYYTILYYTILYYTILYYTPTYVTSGGMSNACVYTIALNKSLGIYMYFFKENFSKVYILDRRL